MSAIEIPKCGEFDMSFKSVMRKIRRKISRYGGDKDKELYSSLLSYPTKQVQPESSYVLFVHGAQYGGAPLLGLDIAKDLICQGNQVVIVSLGYGPLISSYASVTNVQVCANDLELNSCIHILSDLGFSMAICNGALTGRSVPTLRRYNFSIISLIHELPGVVNYFDADNTVRQIIQYSDSLIYPASFVKAQMEKKYGTNPNTLILHQGLANIADNQLTKVEAKKVIEDKYYFDNNKPLFINVATINERKGFDLFAEMAVKNAQANYLWIGDGIEGRFGRKVMSKYAGVPSNLVLPGYVDDKKLLDTIYRAADMLLLTSREEPFGTIVLEAFARETPVAAFTGCGGYEDVVIPFKTGILVSPFDTNAMIDKCTALIHDGAALQEMYSECRKIAVASDFTAYCKRIKQSIHIHND